MHANFDFLFTVYSNLLINKTSKKSVTTDYLRTKMTLRYESTYSLGFPLNFSFDRSLKAIHLTRQSISQVPVSNFSLGRNQIASVVQTTTAESGDMLATLVIDGCGCTSIVTVMDGHSINSLAFNEFRRPWTVGFTSPAKTNISSVFFELTHGLKFSKAL